MAENKKSSFFGLGVLVGTVLGGLAAFFLSPNSGKENREMVMKKIKALKKDIEDMELDKKVKEVWGDVSDESKKTFTKVRKEVLNGLEIAQEKWEEFDREKFMKLVENSIDDAKSTTKETADKLMKLKQLYVKDWNKIFGEKS